MVLVAIQIFLKNVDDFIYSQVYVYNAFDMRDFWLEEMFCSFFSGSRNFSCLVFSTRYVTYFQHLSISTFDFTDPKFFFLRPMSVAESLCRHLFIFNTWVLESHEQFYIDPASRKERNIEQKTSVYQK